MTHAMDRPVRSPIWRTRRVTLGVTAVFALGAMLFMTMAFLGPAERTLRISTATLSIDMARRDVFHDFTPLRGKIVPHDTLFLDALEGGQVEKVMAQAGDRVTAGQPLIAFRNTELELDVLDREGRLIQSITELQTYEKQLEDTRLANEKAAAEISYNLVRLQRAADRRDQLAAKGFLPAEIRDQVHDELNYDARLKPLQIESNAKQNALRQRQLPQIHAELESLRQSLEITRSKLDNLVVKAPVSGRLTDIVKNIGENRNRGERLGEIVPDTGFKVAADVDEFYLGRVRVGQIADAAIGDKTWRLRVTRVYPQVKNGVFAVDLGFDGLTPDGLSPGEAVDGKLSLGGDQPAVVLPAGPFLERTGGDWAMVLEPGGHRAERRRIRLGRRNSDQVEVLQGLKAGERVITSDYTAFDKIDRLELTP